MGKSRIKKILTVSLSSYLPITLPSVLPIFSYAYAFKEDCLGELLSFHVEEYTIPDIDLHQSYN